MATTLEFSSLEIRTSDWKECAKIPFIASIDIQQNRMLSELAEDDPLDVGYGAVNTIYPYTQQNLFSRELKESKVETVVLENDYLKAVFIPSLGGKLWSLYDKVAQKQLLYTNDVIRASNLATRNAWTSGGVEWNIGILGHSPFTCSQIFVATLKVGEMPVLRMYEYERIRKVTYQMDFFLPEDSKFLFCRMRIVNTNNEEIPMYWWSNIAVPELEKGRIVVNADSAYTNFECKVRKVSVPNTGSVDVTYPHQIPKSCDYFFDIPKEKRKFITQLDENGYGLVQLSTNRLQGRKLFVWGQGQGSKRWQNFLTEDAGEYIEIQAGLAKSQYACIPMEANAEWEWLEGYGALQVDKSKMKEEWHSLRTVVNETLDKVIPTESLEELLLETKESIVMKTSSIIEVGSPFGAIENARRIQQGEAPFDAQLDFGQVPESDWLSLIINGTLGQHSLTQAPECYMLDQNYLDYLEKAVKEKDIENWYTWYHLGLYYFVYNRVEEAGEALEKSFSLGESAFAAHALAFVYKRKEDTSKAVGWSKKAVVLGNDNLGLIKDCVEILINENCFVEAIKMITGLSKAIQENSRIRFYLALSYAKIGKKSDAMKILYTPNTLEVEDMREGEVSLSALWDILQQGEESAEELPYVFNFHMD